MPEMLAALSILVATLLHAALMFGAAPLLMGVVGKMRARLLGRRGPPVLQVYFDLVKLSRKIPVIPETATAYYKIWPFVALAATGAAVLLVPGFCFGMLTAAWSDMITLAGLLALARVARLLAGLETGFGFGGAAAGRGLLFGIFADAALLVLVLTFALIAHTPLIDGIGVGLRDGHSGVSLSLGFALAAVIAVALAQLDRPAGDSELAMVDEAMVLEYSGRYLALFHYTACLRVILWFSLAGAVFLPFGMADAAAVLSWPLGLVLWLAKLVLLAVALALFDVSIARTGVFRVPEILGGALVLGVLSAVFLWVAG